MGGTQILPIIETIPLNGEFFDYAEKYAPTGDNELFVEIDPTLEREIRNTSVKIYDFLKCR